jgi:hypothetical protein
MKVRKWAVATKENLEEVLNMVKDQTGIPPSKQKFFEKYIVEPYNKTHVKMTARDICDNYATLNPGKNMTTDSLRKTYLNEYIN